MSFIFNNSMTEERDLTPQGIKHYRSKWQGDSQDLIRLHVKEMLAVIFKEIDRILDTRPATAVKVDMSSYCDIPAAFSELKTQLRDAGFKCLITPAGVVFVRGWAD